MGEPLSRLKYLFDRYVAKALTVEEQEEFMHMIRQAQYNAELNSLIAATVEGAATDRAIGARRADQLFGHIMGAVAPPVVQMRKKGYVRWIAAASVIVLVGTGYLLFPRRERSTVAAVVPQAIKSEIVPAGNKATLTLDDGSTIVLDSAVNGTLASQGDTKVIKLDSGKLAYQEEGVHEGKASYNIINTPRGGKYEVTLPDGTKVWLNAASSLRFPTRFAGENREVALTGEAYFEIAQNKRMPFIVSIRQAAIKVLGTHFNINGYSDEHTINTTLLEGAVKFSSGGVEKLLRPGQQAVFDNSTSAVAVREADMNQVMAWKNGFFEFDNIDLPTIMRQISRWYDVDVEYGASGGDIKLGGGISRKLSLPDLLRLLEVNGVHCKIEGRKIIVN